MSVRDTIADEIEPAVGVYAPELADAIIARLEASGRSIVHKDEIHAPSVERCAQIAKCAWVSADYDLIGIADADMANALCEHAEAQIRELMKEVGR